MNLKRHINRYIEDDESGLDAIDINNEDDIDWIKKVKMKKGNVKRERNE